MKKITFLFALLISTLQGNSQTLISQNFDTALTWTVAHPTGTSTNAGWTRVTAGAAPTCSPFAGAGMAKFASYDIGAGNGYSLTSPAITFAGAAYKVKFKMYRDNGYSADADRIRVYLNANPNVTGATLVGTINRSMALAPIETTEGWYSYSFDLPAGTTGTKYISILGTSAYGNNIYLDEISVNQIINDDAEILSSGIADIVVPSNVTINGAFKNNGSNTINSADLNWQVDNGTIHTQQLSGLNLATNQSYPFNHNDLWAATPGTYSIRIWISNVNGNTDGDTTNNEIIKSVKVASNSTTRFPLYEKFSSSTCGPCATFNGTYFNPFRDLNPTSFALISYQVNWPGAGDPYYTAETGTRRNYYNVGAAPTLFVDAKDGTSFDSALLQSNLTAELLKPSFFAIDATKTLSGTNNMSVDITTTPYLDGDYRLYVAVVEKTTNNNATSNGETEFHNVMMKMIPDASGTVLNCTHDTPIPTHLEIDLSAGTFIEDFADLDVIVFVQNYTTKAIMQSKVATESLSNNQFTENSKLKIYPNPSEGIVRISTENPSKVAVVDISGKTVFSMENVTNQTPLNLSSLQKGVYFATVNDGNTEQTLKLILK